MLLLLPLLSSESSLRHTLEAWPGVSDIIILHTHVSLWRIELDCKLINRNRDARELRVKPAQVSYLSSQGVIAIWTSWPVKFRDYSWHVTFVTLVVTKSVSPVTPNTGHSGKCHKLWLNLLSSRETGERILSWNINRNQICLLKLFSYLQKYPSIKRAIIAYLIVYYFTYISLLPLTRFIRWRVDDFTNIKVLIIKMHSQNECGKYEYYHYKLRLAEVLSITGDRDRR